MTNVLWQVLEHFVHPGMDGVTARRARFVGGVPLVMLPIAGTNLAVQVVIGTTASLVGVGALVSVLLLTVLLAARGRPRPAAWVFASGISVVCNLAVVTTGGAQSGAYPVNGLVIVFAAVALPRAAVGLFFAVAVAGLVYELVAGALASYLLGNGVTQWSLIIGTYLSAMGIGSLLSKVIERNLLARFVEETDALIGGLGPVPPADGDLDSFARRCHKTAGSAAVFGARRLHQTLTALEQAARANDRERLDRLLPELPRIWQDTRAGFAAGPPNSA